MECGGGCGFFGNPETENLCSKCFLTLQKKRKLENGETDVKAKRICMENVEKEKVEPDIYSGSRQIENPVSPNNTISPPTKNLPPPSNRCFTCSKKLGLIPFECVCKHVYCSVHRYADKHECTFDYKSNAAKDIAAKNPLVQASKIEKI